MTPPIDEQLVAQLVGSQFPQYAELPVRHVATGTVNAVFRVGDDLAARLPLAAEIQDWDIDCALAALAGRLPLDTPAVLGTGEADNGYPRRWSLHTWVPGERWRLDRVEDPVAAAVKLAEFLNTLHHIDPATLPCAPLVDGHAAPLVPADLEGRARAVRSYAFDVAKAARYGRKRCPPLHGMVRPP